MYLPQCYEWVSRMSVPAIQEETAGRKGAKTLNVGENFSFVTS